MKRPTFRGFRYRALRYSAFDVFGHYRWSPGNSLTLDRQMTVQVDARVYRCREIGRKIQRREFERLLVAGVGVLSILGAGIAVAWALPLPWHSSTESVRVIDRISRLMSPALGLEGITFFGHWFPEQHQTVHREFAHTPTHSFAPCTAQGMVDFGGFLHFRYCE